MSNLVSSYISKEILLKKRTSFYKQRSGLKSSIGNKLYCCSPITSERPIFLRSSFQSSAPRENYSIFLLQKSSKQLEINAEDPNSARSRLQMTSDVNNESSSSSLSVYDNLITLAQKASVYGIAAGYCLSASLLSIINKWAVMKFPYPGALTALQYLTSALGVLICSRLKLIEHDPLNLLTMWKFLPAASIFYLSLFTNSELLLHANVDTFIVFRSAVPIFVAIGEALYLHQPWPSLSTWASLSTIFLGSVIYVISDYHFTVTAYAWAVAYLISMSVDFVYIKHVVMTIGLNTWGLVLYNNLEALMLFPLELLVMGELKKIERGAGDEEGWLSCGVMLPVGLSCVFGLAISFFGFSCRRAISATGFTVLGIVNKLLTVVVNLVVWDKHSSVAGTVGLLVCMVGGVLYQRSCTKPEASAQGNGDGNVGDEEEQKQLLEMEPVKQDDVSGKNEVVTQPEQLKSSLLLKT